MDSELGPIDPSSRLLQRGEGVVVGVWATDSRLLVTDRRLLVTSGDQVRLDIAFEDLQRIQFDLEAGRPPTLVIVPHRPTDEPQVLSIPLDGLRQVAELLAVVGEHLA